MPKDTARKPGTNVPAPKVERGPMSTIAFRMGDEDVKAIDAAAQDLSDETGRAWSRSDAARLLLCGALEETKKSRKVWLRTKARCA